MKRLLVLIAAAAALAIAVPAWAAKPTHPTHPTHPSHPSHPSQGKGAGKAKGHGKGKGTSSCTMLSEGYRASGTLTSATLTPGAREDRFDGTLVADITRANHKALKGSQTFTLTDARVRLGKGVEQRSARGGRPRHCPRQDHGASARLHQFHCGHHGSERPHFRRIGPAPRMALRAPGFAWFGSRGASWFDCRIGLGTI